MEEIRGLEEVKALLETKQYTRLRQRMEEANSADIATVMEEFEESELLKIFRILPKNMAADVFSYLEVDKQQFIITSLSEKDAAGIIDNLMADDATDLLEEMPANIVKKLLANANPETRRDINHLLRYPEDSAGSIMTVEYVDLKENMTVQDAIDRMHASAPENQKDIMVNYLSAFCFGDIYTRNGLDLKTRELLTFSIISALGGCEAQVKAHVQGNLNAGNHKQHLIDALAQMLPYIGFPRTLNALGCVNAVMQDA